MKLCELQVKNFYCIHSEGIRIKIDNIIVLIGPNNVGKTTVLKAYELFGKSGEPQSIESFYQHQENNAIEIAALCKSSGEPVCLTKKGEGDLVVMDIEVFTRRKKMLKLREELLSVEEDRLAGHMGSTTDELDSYLDSIIDEVGHGKEILIRVQSVLPKESCNQFQGTFQTSIKLPT